MKKNNILIGIKILAGFILYIFSLPNFVILLTPCMRPTPQTAYEIQTCNLDLVFNKYLFMALLGLAATLLLIYWWKRLTKIWLIVVSGFLCALIIYFSFIFYIPIAEKQIAQAPIYLDSLLKK